MAMVEVLSGVKVLVWALAVTDTVVGVEGLVIKIRSGVEIIVVGEAVLNCEFPVPISYSAVLSDAVTDELIPVVNDVIIGVDVVTDVNAKVFAAVMDTLEFAVPTPLEEFGC